MVWREGESRKRVSLGTTDRIVAETTARKVWAGIAKPDKLNTVGDIVDAYLDGLEGIRDEKRKREAWVAAKPYWASLHPGGIEEAASLAYPGWRNRSTNTHRQELSLIRTALNWAVRGKHLEVAPVIALPTMPETSVGHLTKLQFWQFLLGCASPMCGLSPCWLSPLRGAADRR